MKIARSWYGSFDIQNSEGSVRSLHTAAIVSISGRVHAVFAFRLRYCDAVPFFSKYVINRESSEKLCFRIKGLREADCGYWAALLACGLLFFECVFSFHLNILFLSVGTSKK
jgi:hypothetical protein